MPGHAPVQVITLDDLSDRDFATVDEVAAILRCDPRTVRRRIADGKIPGIRAAGWKVPVRWLQDTARGVAA